MDLNQAASKGGPLSRNLNSQPPDGKLMITPGMNSHATAG